MKKYVVYSHSFAGVVFYIGSGRIYTKEEAQTSRPYDFHERSPEWFEFCNNKTDQIKVKILFETNDRQIAYDKETEITIMCMEQGFPLVNKNIGNHITEEHKRTISKTNKGKIFSKEHRRRMSESKKGEKNNMYGKNHSAESRNKISLALKGKAINGKKVLITNNETREQMNFSSIQNAYNFITKEGYKRSYGFFYKNIRKGAYNFKEYTFERMEEAS